MIIIMPYGIVSSETRELIERRREQSHIPPDDIRFMEDVDIDELPDDEPSHTISIIVEGALDEEFDIVGRYEVNVADWIAEEFRDHLDTAFWEILVSAPAYDGFEQVYRVAGDE